MHIAGQTDTTSVKCLINSISRFIHLVSCQTMKPMPLQKNCNNMVGLLKHLKPVLDDVVDYKIFLDENLYRECEELDMQVNEAREFFEKWGPNVSKIHSVLQSGELLIKLQSTAHKICLMIVGCVKLPALANIQHYMQELQSLKKEPALIFIEEALRNQRDNIEPSYDHLKEIVELLKFTSNQDLLKESIAVEKERLNAEANKTKGDMDQINQIVNLVCSLRDYVMKIERTEVKTSVSIPPYFRCPLSLELMADPVIVASGQTYERKAIQKWLDYGLTVCPMTHQRLVHTNLITNYTVKAMILNWCEENNIRLTSNTKHGNSAHISSPSDLLLHQDFDRACSFESLDSSNSNSNQTGSAFEKQKDDNSFRLIKESNRCQNGVTDKFEQRSPAPSCSNSRSESFSSSISSTDYVLPISKEVSGISSKHQNVELSGEITNGCPASTTYKESGIFPWLSGNQFHSAGSKIGMMDNGNNYNENNDNIITSHSKVDSHHVSNFRSDELITTSYVNELIEDLHSESYEAQAAAAEELRLRTKNNVENRIIVGRCGAIIPLLSLLYSDMKITQEHAVTALLNLSINEANKALIMEAGAVEPLIHVLQTGNDGAKENSAAALFSLSVIDNNKVKIGRSGAVKVLVDLLASGTLRGKKDAATALFNLSIFHENKARIVQAGAVKFLVPLLDPTDGMVDKAVALLANLSTVAEGRLEIAREGGILLLVEIVESGSQRGKENAASILLQLCLYSRKFCTLVLQEGAVPPLVALSQSGTPRAREKAQQLLSHFRNQREGATGKGKS